MTLDSEACKAWSPSEGDVVRAGAGAALLPQGSPELYAAAYLATLAPPEPSPPIAAAGEGPGLLPLRYGGPMRRSSMSGALRGSGALPVRMAFCHHLWTASRTTTLRQP